MGANAKLSDLQAAAALSGGELVYIVQGGNSRQQALTENGGAIISDTGVIGATGLALLANETAAEARETIGAGGDIAATINAATSKSTPDDADKFGYLDSTNSFALVQGTWANLKATLGSVFAKLTGGQTFTGGFATTAHNAGTKSSGTYTPDEANGNIQYAVNGGAHTLAPPTNNCTIIVHYTNNASAGAITTSGFTLVDGNSLTTTDTDEFLCYIVKANDVSHLTVKALQ